MLRERSRAAAEIENAQAGASDQPGEEAGALVGTEDELLAPALVRAVAIVQAIEARRRRSTPFTTAAAAQSAMRKSQGTR